MKKSMRYTLPAILLALGLAPVQPGFGADSTERAAIVREKIQNLRSELAQGRNQVTLTMEELGRMLVPGVELRPQFEKFKAELAKMEERAKIARERAITMKEKGQAFFAEWETQVYSIQNEKIRKEAASRLAKRKKSYDRIIATMQDARDELVPFLSDLNDIKTLLDAELNASTVASAKDLIRKTKWHAADLSDSFIDVEKELDRVSAELATYQ
jgi:hypothetical protein